MDVRNIATVPPTVEHNGTTPVWYLMPPGTMRDITGGGSLELVNEFEITGGGAVDPHTHPTHEFYYVLYGHGRMIVGEESQEIGRGTSSTFRRTPCTASWRAASTRRSGVSASLSPARTRVISITQRISRKTESL
jgi:hypothetical protein